MVLSTPGLTLIFRKEDHRELFCFSATDLHGLARLTRTEISHKKAQEAQNKI
jgi:hypothetical protein